MNGLLATSVEPVFRRKPRSLSAWLEFEVGPIGDGYVKIRQTALFGPVGLFGLAY